jgi:hypothetical protein
VVERVDGLDVSTYVVCGIIGNSSLCFVNPTPIVRCDLWGPQCVGVGSVLWTLRRGSEDLS